MSRGETSHRFGSATQGRVAAIAARGVRVELGGRAVLEGIDLEARAGESIALVGRNAAGKTTLLRTLAGLLAPREGEVLLDGHPIRAAAPRERARRLAFVAQRPLVSAAFTVREVVELGRYALPRAPGRVDEALEALGLAPLAERPYHELSVGQQQRSALARSLAQSAPESLLLLDEPFAAMDLGEADRCLGIVRRHARQGGIVIAVLHDLPQAAALADRIWLLDAGRLVEDGPPGTVLAPERLESRFGVAFERTAAGASVPRWGGGEAPAR